MIHARLLVGLACVAACRSTAGPRIPPSTAAAAPVGPAAAAAATGMVPARGPADEPILGPPNGQSIDLATTPDGSAAITTDADASLRLWPTLDGHTEPRALAIASPVHAISIIDSGSGFLVASVDDSRDLTLTQLDAAGHVLAHRPLGGDPAFLGTASFSGGVLAWASDQTITWFGADGATRGRLATLPGERVLAIATRGAHVIALVEVSGGKPEHRVRAVSVPGTAAGSAGTSALAWGDVLSGAFDAALPIAVSPSGKRIAFARDNEIIALEVATQQSFASFAPQPSTTPVVAFFDDDYPAVSSRAAPLLWIDSPNQVPPPNAANVFVGSPALAPGPGALVAIAPGGLALATPSGDHALAYLGYRLVGPAVIAAGGSGTVALADAHGLAMLVDGDLREHGHGHFDLGTSGETAAPQSLAWLGGDDWLVAAAQLHVISAAGAPPIALEAPPEGASFVRAEPSAHLAATAFGLTAALLRWDPAHRAMSRVAHVDLASPYGMIAFAPTNPALANGVRVVRAEQREDAEIQWYADEAMTKPTASARVAAVLAVDATARVYAWTLGEPAHIAIFANGTEVGRLGATTAALFPEPSGAHVAAITDGGVELYDGGKLAWSRPFAKPRQIAWLGTDTLVVLTDRCVARLDAATGAVATHRCGWGFGTWPTVLEDTEGL